MSVACCFPLDWWSASVLGKLALVLDICYVLYHGSEMLYGRMFEFWYLNNRQTKLVWWLKYMLQINAVIKVICTVVSFCCSGFSCMGQLVRLAGRLRKKIFDLFMILRAAWVSVSPDHLSCSSLASKRWRMMWCQPNLQRESLHPSWHSESGASDEVMQGVFPMWDIDSCYSELWLLNIFNERV